MRPRKTKPKMVNVAVPEEMHQQILVFAKMFNLSIGITTVHILKNGFKNIISSQIAKLQSRIDFLKGFETE